MVTIRPSIILLAALLVLNAAASSIAPAFAQATAELPAKTFDPYLLLSSAERDKRAGEFDKAETILLDLLSKQEGAGETAFMAWLLDDLAEVYIGKHDFESAEKILKKAIEVKKDLYGDDESEMVRTLKNLDKIALAKKVS